VPWEEEQYKSDECAACGAVRFVTPANRLLPLFSEGGGFNDSALAFTLSSAPQHEEAIRTWVGRDSCEELINDW
jgi:hypothetical protein